MKFSAAQLIIFLTLLFTLLACGNHTETEIERDLNTKINSADSLQPPGTQEDKTSKDTLSTAADTTTAALLISSFKSIPGEIEGCSCYFSFDQDRLQNNAYLFVANFDSVAFMTIDTKLVRLKLLSTTRAPGTFGDYDHIEVYSSDKYKVTADIKYNKSSGDETWQNHGTITVESKDGRKAVTNIIGECGC